MAQAKKRKTRKVTSEASALTFAKAVNAVSRPIKTK